MPPQGGRLEGRCNCAHAPCRPSARLRDLLQKRPCRERGVVREARPGAARGVQCALARAGSSITLCARPWSCPTCPSLTTLAQARAPVHGCDSRMSHLDVSLWTSIDLQIRSKMAWSHPSVPLEYVLLHVHSASRPCPQDCFLHPYKL